jgi:two-component system sensor histidine kinase TctE
VTIQVEADGEAVSPGDDTSLGILMRNLLDNAIRYGGAGVVTVSVRRSGLFNRLVVRDRGPGMPAGRHGEMFRRFQRGDGAGTPGSGLGLSIVRRICELHGGGVELRNHEAGGLYCDVWLPAIAARPIAASPNSVVADRSSAPS